MEGHTNVGKSSIVASMLQESGIAKTTRLKSDYKFLSPTVSVFPHTTVGLVKVPLNAFRTPKGRTRGSLFDTPGIDGDSAFFSQFIAHDYSRAVSLLKRGGFQRAPEKIVVGNSLSNIISS
jgi:ribosome biogenesis GTPase A